MTGGSPTMWQLLSYTDQKTAATSSSTSAGAQRGHLITVKALQEWEKMSLIMGYDV